MSAELHRALADESARVEEDSLHSARGHFEAARGWRRVHYYIGAPAAVLAAVAGASVVADQPVVAAFAAIVVTALTALQTFLNPSEHSRQHHSAGTQFNSVRHRARMFRTIDLESSAPVTELQACLTDIAERRDQLNASSPPIPRRAYERGRRSILSGEASYAIDVESAAKPLPTPPNESGDASQPGE